MGLAAFDAEVQDLIERAYLGAGVDKLQNVGEARLAGAELELKARVARWLALGAGYGFLHARRTDAEPGVEAYLSVRKLLDANYQTQYGFPDPGRQMWVGVRLQTG